MSSKLKCKNSEQQTMPTNRHTTAATVAASSKRFVTSSPPSKSFVTPGLRRRKTSSQAADFAYDLSSDELRHMERKQPQCLAVPPMKAVPDEQRQLLANGQRAAYLKVRYEHSPNRKFNYPQATSWRIGWLQTPHNCPQQQQQQ